jgi:hypothetical protein
VLVESIQSVLWSHSLERQKRIGKLVSRGENDLVEVDACPIVEFYRATGSRGYAFNGRFIDHVGKTPCVFEKTHVTTSGDVKRAFDDLMQFFNNVCGGYAAANDDNFLSKISM